MSRSIHRIGTLWITSKCFSLPNSRWYHISHGPLNISSSVSHRFPVSQLGSQRLYSQKSDVGSGTSGSALSKEDDRIKMFVNPDVQALLKELTGRDLKRIFRKRKIGQKIKEPKYTFMTENQLEEARKQAEEKADKLLQMPPVLRPRDPIDKLLSFDPYIQGDEKSTLIFTDITMNITDRDRIIVARDPDGTLRQATWDERDKMNAIYFPVPGREFVTPRMFTDPQAMKDVLARASEDDNTYEFVLDRACHQFEPDNPLYISNVEMTYETVDERAHYDFLYSTRHYGPMVFYLVRTRKMDGLLLHYVKQKRISSDAAKLVSLFHVMFPKSKSALAKPSNDIEKVKQYIQLDAVKKGELELALNAYLEEEERKSELEEGLKRQHGVQ